MTRTPRRPHRVSVFRRADHVDDCWQGLAGGAEPGETAEQAARREMMEEVGLTARAGRFFTIVKSREHTSYRWLSYDEAARLLRWDSNKTALWELNERLRRGDPTAG
jgi:dATP pyrophosphohydrolase